LDKSTISAMYNDTISCHDDIVQRLYSFCGMYPFPLPVMSRVQGSMGGRVPRVYGEERIREEGGGGGKPRPVCVHHNIPSRTDATFSNSSSFPATPVKFFSELDVIHLTEYIECRKGASPLATGGSKSDYTDEGIKGNLKVLSECLVDSRPNKGTLGAETR
jgi:hypothetical protein